MIYGTLASFFFAFTFILNRSMNLAGGYWVWAASPRYLFTFPTLQIMPVGSPSAGRVWSAVKEASVSWLVWSTAGFGLFYAPFAFGSVLGESWLAAVTWQLTIAAGVPSTPLFGKRIPIRNLGWSVLVLVGAFMMQVPHLKRMEVRIVLSMLAPILVAVFSYPLGSRKMMAFCPAGMTILERVYSMTLCGAPFWVFMSDWAWVKAGPAGRGQVFQSLCVALFSGAIAAILSFRATDLVRENPHHLAVIEAIQCDEVVFILLGGILLLKDRVPEPAGLVGIAVIVAGMVGNSLSMGRQCGESAVYPADSRQ